MKRWHEFEIERIKKAERYAQGDKNRAADAEAHDEIGTDTETEAERYKSDSHSATTKQHQ